MSINQPIVDTADRPRQLLQIRHLLPIINGLSAYIAVLSESK
jgi:hypothetical protein